MISGSVFLRWNQPCVPARRWLGGRSANVSVMVLTGSCVKELRGKLDMSSNVMSYKELKGRYCFAHRETSGVSIVSPPWASGAKERAHPPFTLVSSKIGGATEGQRGYEQEKWACLEDPGWSSHDYPRVSHVQTRWDKLRQCRSQKQKGEAYSY